MRRTLTVNVAHSRLIACGVGVQPAQEERHHTRCGNNPLPKYSNRIGFDGRDRCAADKYRDAQTQRSLL
jgi:hypothetical protein